MYRLFKPALSIIWPACLLAISACNHSNTKTTTNMTDSLEAKIPSASAFQKTIDGKKTDLYLLKNAKGMEVAITNFGGRVVSILVPDKNGKVTDVVEGFDSVDGYKNAPGPYYGAIIGRYGNRIAKGKFNLEGKEYSLFINNAPNTLHGGKVGFDSKVWDAKQLDLTTLELTYLSKDMEEGFPGNLQVRVVYTLTNNNGLRIEYTATTDKTTIVNLTNHTYFNLNGANGGTILNHKVQILANEYTPIDPTSIPTGKNDPVKGTPFDFIQPTVIGSRIEDKNEQLSNGKGYDHNFVLAKPSLDSPVAIVIGDKSNIEMQVFTQEPGLQFYTGNFMNGQNTMKYGVKDKYRTAFAMETEHFPDSPNEPKFPSVVLKPGKVYNTTTEYRFSLAK
jgi:aldose 1-epimerase